MMTVNQWSGLYRAAAEKRIVELEKEVERLRGALIRIEDLTQHGMGMDAGEETVVWREAHNALKPKETE